MESTEKNVRLAEILRQLTDGTPRGFEEFCTMFFRFNYIDFDEYFGLSALTPVPEQCIQIPVFRGKFIAELLLWGPDTCTAIYDHSIFEVNIKVLEGLLTEVHYRENQNFIEYDGVTTSLAGHIFPHEQTGIQALVNSSGGRSASLHLFNTSVFNLSGVRIFDTLRRKVLQLSGTSESCPWYQPSA